MSVAVRRTIVWGVLVAALAGAIVYALRPQPISVDLASAQLRPLSVSIDDEGEVRVRDVYTLSAPLSGRLLRIDVNAGDPVVADTTQLARIEPAPPAFLDVRTEAELRSAAEAARAAHALAQAQLERAEAELAFTLADVERTRRLFRQQTVSQRTLDDAERSLRVTRASVETAKAQLDVRAHEVEQAEARLLSRGEIDGRSDVCQCVPVTAPVTGVVLRVLRKSEGVVAAGTPLIEIGDPHNIEIVVDLLSEDAVNISPGQRAVVAGWGGGDLAATVRRVEPFGQTKVSALGIEEQRVDVVLDPNGPPEAWSRLGHGYRVNVRLIQFAGDVLTVPLGALFRADGGWASFVVANDGRAQLRSVEIGHRNGLLAEVVGGLSAGERVILYPNDRVGDGVAIVERK